MYLSWEIIKRGEEREKLVGRFLLEKIHYKNKNVIFQK